jgi:hypothetical protein
VSRSERAFKWPTMAVSSTPGMSEQITSTLPVVLVAIIFRWASASYYLVLRRDDLILWRRRAGRGRRSEREQIRLLEAPGG